MSQQGEVIHHPHLAAAEVVVGGLPVADPRENYQYPYPNSNLLVEAVAENLAATKSVTTADQVADFTRSLVPVSDPDDPTVVVISGACREPIYPLALAKEVSVQPLVEVAESNLAIIRGTNLPHVIAVLRNRGMYGKGRTEPQEIGPDGEVVFAYAGDIVNSQDPANRTPDANQLVVGNIQASELEEALTARVGYHVPAAHEALSLAYEMSLIRHDAARGVDISIGADMLWGGVRTNQIGSPVLALLGRLGNTVGVKIGGDSDEAHIAGISEQLNPDNKAGKLLYMLRLGLHEASSYPTILKAIKRHAPNSIVMIDFHGITQKKVVDGKTVKVRAVPHMIRSMGIMAEVCREVGVKFGGIHLETTPDSRRLECVDDVGQAPLDDGDLDPHLNPIQTSRVLNAFAAISEAQFS